MQRWLPSRSPKRMWNRILHQTSTRNRQGCKPCTPRGRSLRQPGPRGRRYRTPMLSSKRTFQQSTRCTPNFGRQRSTCRSGRRSSLGSPTNTLRRVRTAQQGTGKLGRCRLQCTLCRSCSRRSSSCFGDLCTRGDGSQVTTGPRWRFREFPHHRQQPRRRRIVNALLHRGRLEPRALPCCPLQLLLASHARARRRRPSMPLKRRRPRRARPVGMDKPFVLSLLSSEIK